MDKYQELVEKLQCIDNSYLFEKTLNTVLQKYSISLEELEDEKRNKETFWIQISSKDLFFQVVFSVLAPAVYIIINKKTKIVIEMTKFQRLEIQTKFEFFSQLFKKESKNFFNDFCNKYGLN